MFATRCAVAALSVTVAACGGGGGGGGGLSISSVNWPTPSGAVVANTGAIAAAQANGGNGVTNAALFTEDAEYARSAQASHNASAAYDRNVSGAGVTVAVIDTGVSNPGGLFGARLLAGSEPDNGVSSHGTRGASVLAAGRVAGANGMIGTAWGASIRGYEALSGGANDALSQARMAADVNAARTANVDVINLSVEDSAHAGQALGVAASLGTELYRAARDGAVIVVAAGNGYNAQPSTLAAFPLYAESALKSALGAEWTGNELLGRHLVVAALDGANNSLAGFSNRCGAARYFCLSARGVNVPVIDKNGNPGTVQGTSFAAPQVAGAVALLKQLWPALQPQQITEILLRTADDLGATGVDEVFGYGRLNLDRATAPVGATVLPRPGAYPQLATNGALLSETALVVNPTMAPVMASLASGGPSLAFLDSYGRGFRISLAAFARQARRHLDLADAFEGFGQRRDMVIPMGAGGSLRLSADPDAGPNAATNALRFEGGGMTVTMARSGRPSDIAGVASFASSSAPEGYIDAARLEHPYLALTAEARSAGISMELGDGISAGVYLSAGETDAGVAAMAAGVTAARRFDNGAQVSTTLGVMREEGGMLGAAGTGALAMGRSETAYASVAGRAPLTDDLDLVADAHVGATRMGDGGALVSGGHAVSTAWNIGVERRGALLEGDALRLSIGQPLTVENGEMVFNMPEFDGSTSRATAGLGGETRETDIRLGWTGQPSAQDSVSVGATLRLNADGARGDTEAMAGVRWRRKF